MFLYYTRGLMRWVGGVHCGDTGAMKAEGQARLELPRNLGYAYTGYCVLAVHKRVIACWQWDMRSQGWWVFTSTQLIVDYVGSPVLDVSTVAGVREQRRGRSCFAACVLLCALVAALRRTKKPLLSACCDAAALLCLAPLPPANKRASVRRRC